MRLEPKVKIHSHRKYIILSIIVLLAVSLGLWYMFGYTQPDTEDEGLQICEMNTTQTQSFLSKEYESTYALSDYFFYGEVLNVFVNPYQIDQNDPVFGKTLLLKDVCSEQEYAYVLGNKVDKHIDLTYVKNGLYELYIIDELIEKRVVFTSEIEDQIKSVSNADGNRLISLHADMNMYEDEGIQLLDNYAFLTVEDTKLAEDEYDIIIDPAAYDYDFTYSLNLGSEGHGLYEANESYQAAILLQEELELLGYKVLITRDDSEALNSYGEGGRIHKAYEASAKYYIKLGFNQGAQTLRGLDISYSAHASDTFAAQVVYTLEKYPDIVLSGLYSSSLEGVIDPQVLEGMDGVYGYDSNLWIRESGGKATGAGRYSENSVAGTASYSLNNVYGIQAIDISLGYLSNAQDVSYWNTSKEVYMEALADALHSYMSVSEE